MQRFVKRILLCAGLMLGTLGIGETQAKADGFGFSFYSGGGHNHRHGGHGGGHLHGGGYHHGGHHYHGFHHGYPRGTSFYFGVGPRVYPAPVYRPLYVVPGPGCYGSYYDSPWCW